VLTGLLDDEANTHKGSTSAMAIATLMAIKILKERRRRRFVVIAGPEPRREAYSGSVHDDEKTKAMEATRYGKKGITAETQGDSTDALPKNTWPLPMEIHGQRSLGVCIGHRPQPCQVSQKRYRCCTYDSLGSQRVRGIEGKQCESKSGREEPSGNAGGAGGDERKECIHRDYDK
jgi:hypothetical protein